MSWNIFKSGDKKASPRSLSHPKELQVGDIIKLGFTEHSQLSNERFKIVKLSTYDLGGEAKKKTTFTIEDENGTYQLSVVTGTHGEQLEFGIPIIPDDVDEIFTFEQFGQLFDDDSNQCQKINRHSEPKQFTGWTSAVYMQEAMHQAYVYQADYRNSRMPEDVDEGDCIDYMKFVSDDRKYALQIEVYDGGKTDVYLQVLLDIEKIEEMWPVD